MNQSLDDVFASVRNTLLYNMQSRKKYGGLTQDSDCLPGEVFLGIYKKADFDALPLSTKRKGGPARVVRFVGEVINGVYRVHVPTFAAAYGDKESFEVFVHTFELHMLGIEY